MIRLFFPLFLLVFPIFLRAQKDYRLSFETDDYLQVKKKIKKKFNTRSDLEAYLATIQELAQKKGYLLASIDSVYAQDEFDYKAIFFLGHQWNKIHLYLPDQENEFLRSKSGFSTKTALNLPLSPNKFNQSLKHIERVYLNNAYPFVRIAFDSVHILEHQIDIYLGVSRGTRMTWGNVHVRGDSSISEKMIANILKIKPSTPYSERTFELVAKRLDQLAFIEQIQAPQVLFTQTGADLYTYLKSNPSSSINGIIGLQPQSETNKLSFTGELNLKLQNVLRKAEYLAVDWYGLPEKTQDLSTELDIPYLFQTQFGINGLFYLHKNDSTFLTISPRIMFNYHFSSASKLSVFFQAHNSTVLDGVSSADTANIGTLKTQFYGISFSSSQVNDLRNPTKGWRLNVDISAGNRSSQMVDTLNSLQHTVYRMQFDVNKFFPLSDRYVFVVKNTSFFYYAPVIFVNETYRFGGMKIQRGFDEQELRASAQTTWTLEARFLLDNMSFLFLFFDQSWYENSSQNYYKDTPYGFGAGFSFQTSIGAFSISYALGKQFTNPVLFRDGKIHFGYLSFF